MNNLHNKIILSVLCCIFAASAAFAAQLPVKLNQAEAKKLAILVYNADTGLYLESAPPDKFFEFTVMNPKARAGMIIGYLAVNPWTGDVWDWWSCERQTNPALRKAQSAIKRRFSKIELKQYPRLHNLKPVCLG